MRLTNFTTLEPFSYNRWTHAARYVEHCLVPLCTTYLAVSSITNRLVCHNYESSFDTFAIWIESRDWVDCPRCAQLYDDAFAIVMPKPENAARFKSIIGLV